MTTIWPLPVISILNKGFSLDAIGVENWAFRKLDAISAIEKLSKIGTPILQGKVFEIIEDSMEYNYDGWQCEPNPGESKIDFFSRCQEEAVDYIEDYPTEGSIFFVLTPGL